MLIPFGPLSVAVCASVGSVVKPGFPLPAT